jgi:hypothetical protein
VSSYFIRMFTFEYVYINNAILSLNMLNILWNSLYKRWSEYNERYSQRGSLSWAATKCSHHAQSLDWNISKVIELHHLVLSLYLIYLFVLIVVKISFNSVGIRLCESIVNKTFFYVIRKTAQKLLIDLSFYE